MDTNESPTQSYLICSTPRTGSTLLCSMLKSSRVAGQPESYFRKQDEQSFARQWNILCSRTNTYNFSSYLGAAIAAGSSKNGVFATRIMWGTMEELVANLIRTYPETEGNDLNILTHAFGHTRYIYLKRRDVIAQAVSRLRAEQTNLWHISDESKSITPSAEPQYDFDQICKFVQEANEHNAAWENWFDLNGIEPYSVQYEDLAQDLAQDPVKITRQISEFLKLNLPQNVSIHANNKRLSDELNEEWIKRYHSDMRTYE